MNLLGKILVVLVTLMSISFLGVAIAVFTTHTDRKEVVDAQNTKIQELNADLDQLQVQYKRNASNLELEIESAEQQIRKLENERVALVGRNQGVQNQISDLRQERRDVTMAVAKTQATNAQLATKNVQLEKNIDTTQQASNVAFDETVRATSELHEAKLELESQLERNAQMVEQVGGDR